MSHSNTNNSYYKLIGIIVITLLAGIIGITLLAGIIVITLLPMMITHSVIIAH